MNAFPCTAHQRLSKNTRNSILKSSQQARVGVVVRCTVPVAPIRRHIEPRPVPDRDERFDLVLSSGFLAFASHSGFLQAVEEAEIQVAGIMGTSAGALAGSLFAAGYSAHQVAAELSRVAPIELLQPTWQPWKGGIFSLEKVVDKLYELLPPTFEDLKYEFACGVVTGDGHYKLVDRGPLPEAVVASAAIPFIFMPVDIPVRTLNRNVVMATNVENQCNCRPIAGEPVNHDAAFNGHSMNLTSGCRNCAQGQLAGLSSSNCKDGGMVDRIGLKGWRDRRRLQLRASGKPDAKPPRALVHVISRSSPFSGADDVAATGESNVVVLRSPRSNVNLLDLGDFRTHMQAAYLRAKPGVEATRRRMPVERKFA